MAPILAGEHTLLEGVRFTAPDGATVRISLPLHTSQKLTLTRGRLDQILLDRARHGGAEIHQNCPLKSLSRTALGWKLETDLGQFEARDLVAADGRNSSVARLLGLMPKPSNDERIAAQIHFAPSAAMEKDVCLRFVPQGYVGLAPVGHNLANLCLVSRAREMQHLKSWAVETYQIPQTQPWRSLFPLSRRSIFPVSERLWLTGDAATVVEPFTGEGIAYAIITGALCAQALVNDEPRQYVQSHRNLYSGRLWLNQLARATCLYPNLGSLMVKAGLYFPQLLKFLTRRVVAASRAPWL